MNTSRFRFLLMGVFFPALFAALHSRNRSVDSGPSPEPIQAANLVVESLFASPPETREARVTVEDFKFEPERLSIRPGTKVTWVNKDDEPHSATSSEKPKRFDSGVLDSAQSFSFTFQEPGSFAYFCKLHPHMTGVIVVE